MHRFLNSNLMPERKRKEDKRMKISGTIPLELYNWIEEQIKKKRFYNRSHAIEYCLDYVKEEEKKRKD